MNWLRTRAKKLSTLALLALAVQFGLSFGHFHRDGLPTASIASAHTSVSAPESGQDTDARGDLCAICVTAAMANTAVDASPPALPLRATFARTSVSFATIFAIAETRSVHAQSRAPPTT